MKKSLGLMLIGLLTCLSAGEIENKMNMVLQSWNKSNNTQDTKTLIKLYDINVKYYGANLSRGKCIIDKKRFFKKHPHFAQTISNPVISLYDDDIYKISFDKLVQIKINGEKKYYPSYLLVKNSSSPVIVEEGDAVTDKNLKRSLPGNQTKQMTTNKNATSSNLPFIGMRNFNFFGGLSNTEFIYIAKDGTYILINQNIDEEGWRIVDSGRYKSIIKNYRFTSTHVSYIDKNGKVKNICNKDGVDNGNMEEKYPCTQTLGILSKKVENEILDGVNKKEKR